VTLNKVIESQIDKAADLGWMHAIGAFGSIPRGMDDQSLIETIEGLTAFVMRFRLASIMM
jgi:hypothetical protein